MDQAMMLDMHEFKLLAKAHKLKMIDQEYLIHTQAFANNKATLRDKKGKLVYSSFKKFYDYDKALGKVAKKDSSATDSRLSGLRAYYKKQNGGKNT